MEVLFANEAFYAAFASGDADAMDRLWAEDIDVACLHPGNPPIYDRNTIIESWRQILADEGVGKIKMHSARVIAAGDLAIVTCFENFDQTTLVATNAFVRENGTWRMTLHQAGVCNDEIPVPEAQTDGSMH